MDEKMCAIEKNGTWELTDLSPEKKPIGVKWVNKTKYKSNGEIDRFKAWLVTKGYKQKSDIFAKPLKIQAFLKLTKKLG
nr:Retrovirus-related Pol polyprotein from transposon TNT 1-94 [Ipomoea batatas]GME21345.1 Retrovirus-related Pol polyprotein from transposon TNT 1-94 [Ipomoea batatas]